MVRAIVWAYPKLIASPARCARSSEIAAASNSPSSASVKPSQPLT